MEDKQHKVLSTQRWPEHGHSSGVMQHNVENKETHICHIIQVASGGTNYYVNRWIVNQSP